MSCFDMIVAAFVVLDFVVGSTFILLYSALDAYHARPPMYLYVNRRVSSLTTRHRLICCSSLVLSFSLFLLVVRVVRYL